MSRYLVLHGQRQLRSHHEGENTFYNQKWSRTWSLLWGVRLGRDVGNRGRLLLDLIQRVTFIGSMTYSVRSLYPSFFKKCFYLSLLYSLDYLPRFNFHDYKLFLGFIFSPWNQTQGPTHFRQGHCYQATSQVCH